MAKGTYSKDPNPGFFIESDQLFIASSKMGGKSHLPALRASGVHPIVCPTCIRDRQTAHNIVCGPCIAQKRRRRSPRRASQLISQIFRNDILTRKCSGDNVFWTRGDTIKFGPNHIWVLHGWTPIPGTHLHTCKPSTSITRNRDPSDIRRYTASYPNRHDSRRRQS